MVIFFVCIVIIGIIFSGVSLVLVFVEKNKDTDYRADLSDRKNTLIETIEDAETLVAELNRFSGYIVEQCEEKQTELAVVMSEADTLIRQMTFAIKDATLKQVSAVAATTIGETADVLEDRKEAKILSAPETVRNMPLSENKELVQKTIGETEDVFEDRKKANILSVSETARNGLLSENKELVQKQLPAELDGGHLPDDKEDGQLSADLDTGHFLADLEEDQAPFNAEAEMHETVQFNNVLPLRRKRPEVKKPTKQDEVILRLSLGMTFEDIAKELHIGKGEVALIARIEHQPSSGAK